MTEHLVLTGGAADASAIARAAELLAKGAIVAIPTDTVYGLACRSAYQDSVQAIFALKGRPPEKSLPWLIPDADAAFSFVNAVPPRAKRLMDAFWPGGLTLVLGADGETVALRVPALDALRDILRRAGGPVVATSANPSGATPALCARDVEAAFPAGLAAIVDGGSSLGGRESTIVRVDPAGRYVILRRGYVTPEALAPVLATRVLVVCTGNTCRSPMAAGVLAKSLSEKLKPPALVEVRSAGIAASEGAPATATAIAAARRAGIDLLDHRASAIDSRAVETADFVYAMSSEHLAVLRTMARHAEMLSPDGLDVPDPFGGSASLYEATLGKITTMVARRLPAIVAHATEKST